MTRRPYALLHIVPMLVVAGGLLAAGCGRDESSATVTPTPKVRLSQSPIGRTDGGTVIDRITLRNGNGVEMTVLTYGGVIETLKTPDKAGAFDDIVLGFDDLPSYQTKSPYFGCLIGRY